MACKVGPLAARATVGLPCDRDKRPFRKGHARSGRARRCFAADPPDRPQSPGALEKRSSVEVRVFPDPGQWDARPERAVRSGQDARRIIERCAGRCSSARRSGRILCRRSRESDPAGVLGSARALSREPRADAASHGTWLFEAAPGPACGPPRKRTARRRTSRAAHPDGSLRTPLDRAGDESPTSRPPSVRVSRADRPLRARGSSRRGAARRTTRPGRRVMARGQGARWPWRWPAAETPANRPRAAIR